MTAKGWQGPGEHGVLAEPEFLGIWRFGSAGTGGLLLTVIVRVWGEAT